MTRRRLTLGLLLLLSATLAVWLVWVKPKSVDMAAYVPADSLLYLEANRPLEVIQTLAETDAWKTFDKMTGNPQSKPGSHWLQDFVRWTGIGPVQSVILSRAQVAVVIMDLGTAESGDTLKLTAEGAILIQTHTAEARIKPQVEEALKTLAEKTYGRPTYRHVTVDGVEFIEWLAPDSSRQIVGTIAGTLVIIGTSEKVVQQCIGASRGQVPALKDDVELKRLRLQLAADRALSFGYVPAGKSARLLAVGIPLLLGRAPDSDFQRLITTGTARVFGSLGWSSAPYLTGIEDRYLISLQPDALAHLKPSFRPTGAAPELKDRVPGDVYSITSYSFADPAAAWLSLKTTVSSQVDALSAIIFASLLKSSLLSFGIEEPEVFLGAVDGDLVTLRFDESEEHSILVAGVRDHTLLRKMLAKTMSLKPRSSNEVSQEIFEDSSGEIAVSLRQDLIVLGAAAQVRRYLDTREQKSLNIESNQLKRLRLFSSPIPPSIVTCTNDGSRVRSFFVSLTAAKGTAMAGSALLDEAIASLPYSVTETTVGDNGLERTTRSPLGQFSTLLPLLIPDRPDSPKGLNRPR